MTPSRLQQIESLYHASLERALSERAGGTSSAFHSISVSFRFSVRRRSLFDSPQEILFAERPHFFQPPRSARIGKRFHMG